MIVAYLRPDGWDLPLFVHVLGAIVLFGGVLAASALGLSAWRGHAAPVVSRLALRTLLFVVVPGWVVMRAGAQWILDKEYPHTTPGWVDVGFAVSEPGGIFILLLGGLAYASARRGGRGRATAAFATLAPVYLVALGVGWFAMSAKPGS